MGHSRRAHHWLTALVLGLVCGGLPAFGVDLLETRFATTPPGWTLPAAWQVADGELLATTNASHARYLVPQLHDLGDCTIMVTMRQAEGELGAVRAGVLYHARDADNAYFALLRADGGYWLGKLVGGKPIPLLTGLVSAIRTAGPNTLVVKCRGDRQTVSINGSQLIARNDGSYERGGVGLWSTGTGTTAYTEFKVSAPEGQAALPPLPAPTPNPTPAPAPTPELDPLPAPEPNPTPGTTQAPDPTPAPTAPVPPPLLTTPSGITAPPSAAASEGTEALTVPETLGPRGSEPTPMPAPPGPVLGPGPDAPAPGPLRTVEPAPPEPVAPAEAAPSPAEPAPGRSNPPTVTPAPAEPAVLFSESFDPPKHKWNEDAFRRIEDGELKLKAVAGYKLSGFARGFADYRYHGRARSLSAQGGTYGLVARLQENGDSGYLLVIRNPDVFAVARLDAGKPVLLRRGQAALSPDWNQLDVRCLGSTFTFTVNGAVVATFKDDRYPRGGLGVWVDQYRDAAFDDLQAESLLPVEPVGPIEIPTTDEPADETPAEVLLKEDFDPPSMQWQTDANRELKDGALELRAPQARYILSGVADDRFSDYSAALEVERLGGPANGRVGLVARVQPDGRSGYLFALYSVNRFVVLRLDPNGASELARGEAAVRPGVNTLAVRCRGSRLAFDLNGAEVVTIQDDTYRSGGFGLYVDNGARARFDNLVAVALK